MSSIGFQIKSKKIFSDNKRYFGIHQITNIYYRALNKATFRTRKSAWMMSEVVLLNWNLEKIFKTGQEIRGCYNKVVLILSRSQSEVSLYYISKNGIRYEYFFWLFIQKVAKVFLTLKDISEFLKYFFNLLIVNLKNR